MYDAIETETKTNILSIYNSPRQLRNRRLVPIQRDTAVAHLPLVPRVIQEHDLRLRNGHGHLPSTYAHSVDSLAAHTNFLLEHDFEPLRISIKVRDHNSTTCEADHDVVARPIIRTDRAVASQFKRNGLPSTGVGGFRSGTPARHDADAGLVDEQGDEMRLDIATASVCTFVSTTCTRCTKAEGAHAYLLNVAFKGHLLDAVAVLKKNKCT